MGLQRVRHNWETLFTFRNTETEKKKNRAAVMDTEKFRAWSCKCETEIARDNSLQRSYDLTCLIVAQKGPTWPQIAITSLTLSPYTCSCPSITGLAAFLQHTGHALSQSLCLFLPQPIHFPCLPHLLQQFALMSPSHGQWLLQRLNCS